MTNQHQLDAMRVAKYLQLYVDTAHETKRRLARLMPYGELGATSHLAPSTTTPLTLVGPARRARLADRQFYGGAAQWFLIIKFYVLVFCVCSLKWLAWVRRQFFVHGYATRDNYSLNVHRLSFKYPAARAVFIIAQCKSLFKISTYL